MVTGSLSTTVARNQAVIGSANASVAAVDAAILFSPNVNNKNATPVDTSPKNIRRAALRKSSQTGLEKARTRYTVAMRDGSVVSLQNMI